MSYSFGKSIVTDGLVFYVDVANGLSYLGSGTAVDDLIGSADLTLSNGAAVSGSFIELDGIDDTCNGTANSVPAALQFDFSDSFTMSAWVRPDFSDTGGFGTAFGPKEYSGNDTACVIINGKVNDRLTPRFWMRDNSSQYELLTATTFSMTQGSVHNIAVTYSGTRGASSWKMYVDGVEITLTRTSAGSATAINYSAATLCIGSRESTNAFWEGGVGLCSAYNRALTASEILQNYNALKNRFV